MIRFDGYTMEEVVDTSLYMVDGIEKGTGKYYRLIADLVEYQEYVEECMIDHNKKYTAADKELLVVSAIVYSMLCNEVHGTEEVTMSEKEVITSLLLSVLGNAGAIV